MEKSAFVLIDKPRTKIIILFQGKARQKLPARLKKTKKQTNNSNPTKEKEKRVRFLSYRRQQICTMTELWISDKKRIKVGTIAAKQNEKNWSQLSS